MKALVRWDVAMRRDAGADSMGPSLQSDAEERMLVLALARGAWFAPGGGFTEEDGEAFLAWARATRAAAALLELIDIGELFPGAVTERARNRDPVTLGFELFNRLEFEERFPGQLALQDRKIAAGRHAEPEGALRGPQ